MRHLKINKENSNEESHNNLIDKKKVLPKQNLRGREKLLMVSIREQN